MRQPSTAANIGRAVHGARSFLAAGGSRSWTAPAIIGPWTALADSEATPFARANNVTFDGTAWTQDISHGEMIRSRIDQTLTISPRNLRYVYQGMDPNASDPYKLPALAARPADPRPTPLLTPLEEQSETETAHRKHGLDSRRGPGGAGVPGVGRTDPV
jgi:hypothetical protein